MARSHGKILVDIWLDPDFLALTRAEQWTYFMLLSQPRLTLVGSIDYRPNQWEGLAADLSRADVEAPIAVLEDRGFVCVDYRTEELLVRSMTKHDGLRTGNPKLLKGLWTAWKGVASCGLRKVAVDNMPATLFGTDETPPAAEQMRRSPRINWPMTNPTDPAIVPPSAFRLPTSTVQQSAPESSLTVEKIDPALRDLGLDNLRELKAHTRESA